MKVIYTLIIALFTFVSVQAQIVEEKRSMNLGNYNSLSIEIPNANAKIAKSVWKDYIKANAKKAKVKKVKKTDLLFTDNAQLGAIGGSNLVDVYLKLKESGENVEATVWFDLGDAYLNSSDYSSKYEAGEKFVLRYALEVAVASTKEELKVEEKKGKKLNKDLSSLVKSNKSYHDAIEKAKATIQKMESNIQQNEIDQEATKKAIEEQNQTIEGVKTRLSELEN